MAWTNVGAAVRPVGRDGYPFDKPTTSTSTLLVRNESRLRMYFARAESEFPDFTPTSAPTVLDGGTSPVGYIDSDVSFTFDLVTESDFTLTAVPSEKGPVPRLYPDGTMRDSYVRYQDPHVLRLPRGMGYLMVLGEYIREWDTTTNDLNCTRQDTVSFVVGFWSADPTFEDCKGPYWLVGRNQEDGPAWLGVPSTVVLRADGVEYLYVYFVAEPSLLTEKEEEHSADLEIGTWARRIRLRVLMDVIDEDYVERAQGGDGSLEYDDLEEVWDPDEGPDFDATADRTDDEEWDPATDSHLLRGENLGKVTVWVATGTRWRAPFTTANAWGNTEFEDYYYAIKVVDPVAVVSNEGQGGQRLMLYFSGNVEGLYDGAERAGFGAWCAVAVLESTAGVYGMHFVVQDGVDIATDVGESSLVSAGALDAGGEYMQEGRLDPDPAELPDGTWVVNVGAVLVEEDKKGNKTLTTEPMLRIEGDSADGAPVPGFPWR